MTDVNAVIFPWNLKEGRTNTEVEGEGGDTKRGRSGAVVLLSQKRVPFVKKNLIHARFVSFFVREWHVTWHGLLRNFNSIFKMYIHGIRSADISYHS